MDIVLAVLVLLESALIFAVLAALPTWLLWNALVPSLFGLPHISFWQALGLLILSSLLFKGGPASASSSK